MVTDALGRSRIYRAWVTDAVDIVAADGSPVQVSIDGEVAAASTRIHVAKRHARLLVYRKAEGDRPAG